MGHLPNPDYPPFVSERLSAVTNVPMQFLVSVGIATVILIAADFTSNGDEAAGFVDVQRTASISASAKSRDRQRWLECRQSVPSEYDRLNIGS